MTNTRFTASDGWYIEGSTVYGRDGRLVTTVESLLEVPEVALMAEYGAHQARARGTLSMVDPINSKGLSA